MHVIPIGSEGAIRDLCRDFQECLMVRVLDQDVGKQDDLLGVATLKLDGLLDGEQHTVSLDIRAHTSTDTDKAAGQVDLLVRFHSFAGAWQGRPRAWGTQDPGYSAQSAAVVTVHGSA